MIRTFLMPFSHGGRQKLRNATCYDPYIPTSLASSTFIHLIIHAHPVANESWSSFEFSHKLHLFIGEKGKILFIWAYE